MHLPHPLLLWLLPVRVEVVVDRIEPPMAVLEWAPGSLTDMPLALLPPDITEGARLEVVIHRARSGLPAAAPGPLVIQTAAGPVPLPLTFRPATPSRDARLPHYALLIQKVD